MNIVEIIKKDEPHFTGICLREAYAELETVKQFGISMAWLFNKYRAQNYKKILVAGYDDEKGYYFLADIKEIISVKEAYHRGVWQNAIDYQESIFGKWITERINGNLPDNEVLDARFVVIFENATEIKQFSEDFQFSRSSFYYINGQSLPILNLGEHIEVKNIGKIKSANIKLNGLTVIAGVNDTGKSTIGKVVFSIIKAISRYEQDLNESKEQILYTKIEKLYFKLRRLPNFEKLQSEFYPKSFVNQLKKFLDRKQISLFSDENEEELDIDRFFEYKQSLLSGFPNNILNELSDIKKNVLLKEDKQEQIRRALNRVIFSEFLSEISPKGTNKKSIINYKAGNSLILAIEFEQNKITSSTCNDELMFSDVVYIETPLLLQMYDLIQAANTMFENETTDSHSSLLQRSRPKVSLHIKDLMAKIENAKYFSNTFFESDFASIDVLKNISNIINGGFTFDKDNNDLVFTMNKGDENKSVKIKPVNTASGIKSFGLIQLLLQANILNDKCLLIIDEPENHLHPEWQVKYAQMLVELVKSEISVIVTSHSPYMIQALKYYSEESNIQDKTAYYFAELDENKTQSNIREVTNDLNVIFSTLAAPLRDLVWK